MGIVQRNTVVGENWENSVQGGLNLDIRSVFLDSLEAALDL